MRLLYLMFQLCLLFSPQQTGDDCAWTQKTATIDSWIRNDVWSAPAVQAYACTEDGKKSQFGRFVFIKNGSTAPFYYRGVVDSYYAVSAKRRALRVSSANMNYYEVPPATSRILDCSGYESRQTSTLPTQVVLDIKFCQTGNPSSANVSQQLPDSVPSADEPTTLDLDSLNQHSGSDAYSYGCGGKKVYYVSDVFRYKSGKDPDLFRKNLLKSYWNIIKARISHQNNFDALLNSTDNDCNLYFETGRNPLTRNQAVEVRNGVVAPLMRSGIHVNTVKITQ